MKLQRLGGYAAIASMCVYTVIIVIYSLGLSRYPEINEPIKAMTVIPAIQGGLYTFCLLYVVCGLLSLILALALHERMQSKAPYLTRLLLIAAATGTVMQMASSVIYITQGVAIAQAQDISAWRALVAITHRQPSFHGSSPVSLVLSALRVCHNKNPSTFTSSRLVVVCCRHPLAAELCGFPTRWHRSADLRGNCLDWNCATAGKAAPTGFSANG